MPDSPSPFDDPFADLFGKLPDPRTRDGALPGPRRSPAPLVPGPDEAGAFVHGPLTTTTRPAPTVGSATASAVTSPGERPASASPSREPIAPGASLPRQPDESAGTPNAGSERTENAGAPLSRRAAREAAAAEAARTGQVPAGAAAAGADQPDEPVQNAAPDDPAPADPAPVDRAPADRAPVPATAVLPATTFDDVMMTDASPRDASSMTPADEPRSVASQASLEDLFTGRSSSDDLGHAPPPANKRRRRVGGWIALAIVLLFLGGIAAGGLWVWNTYEDQIRELMGWEEPKDYEAGQATGEALVTISQGDTGGTISQTLYDAGVTKTPEAFYDMLVETGQNPTFYPGVYRLQQKMTSDAALTALQDPASKLENSALVREGLTVDQTLPILAESLGMPLEEFQAAAANPATFGVPADSLEGWLFPAMYTFDPGATPTDVIQTLVNRTIESLDTAGVPAEDRQRVLTVASIIQREARFEDDFYKVSRVIENRLAPTNDQTFGYLQMDSTAQYGFGEMHDGTVSSSQEALDDDNPWNTYRHPGLPKGPIANPGDLAIDAAMHPVDGPWLYFVTVNPDSGETIFTTTGAEHEQAVKQWQQWCSDNPGKC
ncbi:endolytic transglycosylase MltG [Microbacterium sp. BK668]|uniref:endolytic transglycosylase MltG n=1 Tax=Microbacterium sp. BK668 TaxID=2512118 RepID=UPI00105EFBB5|nr:endolytic transglycosylase MltG [Microbacterium sp. BK668]TDN92941.1 UPF0755 protein [Microbacterium sp. BK668]